MTSGAQAFFAAEGPRTGQDQQQGRDVETVHYAMLEMLYWTIVGMVHRAQLAVRTMRRENSLQTLQEAAEQTTAIAQALQEQDLLRFQPPIIVTAPFGSAMQHWKDVVSGVPAGRGLAQQHLNQSLASLKHLQGVWFSADNVVNFFATIPTTRTAAEDPATAPRPRPALQQNIITSYSPAQKHPIHGLSIEANTRQTMMAEDDLALTTPMMLPTSSPTHPSHCLADEAPADANYEELSFEFDAMYNVGMSNDFDFAQFDAINWTNIPANLRNRELGSIAFELPQGQAGPLYRPCRLGTIDTLKRLDSCRFAQSHSTLLCRTHIYVLQPRLPTNARPLQSETPPPERQR